MQEEQRSEQGTAAGSDCRPFPVVVTDSPASAVGDKRGTNGFGGGHMVGARLGGESPYEIANASTERGARQAHGDGAAQPVTPAFRSWNGRTGHPRFQPSQAPAAPNTMPPKARPS